MCTFKINQRPLLSTSIKKIRDKLGVPDLLISNLGFPKRAEETLFYVMLESGRSSKYGSSGLAYISKSFDEIATTLEDPIVLHAIDFKEQDYILMAEELLLRVADKNGKTKNPSTWFNHHDLQLKSAIMIGDRLIATCDPVFLGRFIIYEEGGYSMLVHNEYGAVEVIYENIE